ncbi:hypothetical protein [Microcoleus sp. BROC3]|uniref:hypothetical protein n=1 Tax=Microcoleus sp. BROC3 TaxID=3055323 RepID=UPI002FD533A7
MSKNSLKTQGLLSRDERQLYTLVYQKIVVLNSTKHGKSEPQEALLKIYAVRNIWHLTAANRTLGEQLLKRQITCLMWGFTAADTDNCPSDNCPISGEITRRYQQGVKARSTNFQ